MYYIVRVFLVVVICLFFFFKQKTAYEMRISDWSSEVCSSDLTRRRGIDRDGFGPAPLVSAHMDRHRPAPLMADKTNAQCLIDIKAALTAAKPKEVTTLEKLAGLRGTSKQPFLTNRRELAASPNTVTLAATHHPSRPDPPP